jgi:pimeloyl-ACP methyl ester carboxylesterase
MEKIYKEINWIQTKILKFYDKKNKENILILHGWWGKSDSWINFSKILFENWYNVFVPDLPGFWDTFLNKVFSLDDYALFIEDLVSFLELKDFILFWHSNWWAISIKVASREKISIKKLVLNNSAWVRVTLKMTLKRKFFKVLWLFFKPFKDFILFQKLRLLFYKVIWNYDYLNSLRKPFLEETYKNVISEDLQDIMKNISLRTLLIWWELDKFTPISYWNIINENIKKSKLVVIEWEWHSIHLKNALKLSDVFLENV